MPTVHEDICTCHAFHFHIFMCELNEEIENKLNVRNLVVQKIKTTHSLYTEKLAKEGKQRLHKAAKGMGDKPVYGD